VLQAVVRILQAAEGPMRACEVYAGVRDVLGDKVSKDSVVSCLSTGVREDRPRFERVALGTYRLARDRS
jgi:hypothetical protein